MIGTLSLEWQISEAKEVLSSLKVEEDNQILKLVSKRAKFLQRNLPKLRVFLSDYGYLDPDDDPIVSLSSGNNLCSNYLIILLLCYYLVMTFDIWAVLLIAAILLGFVFGWVMLLRYFIFTKTLMYF